MEKHTLNNPVNLLCAFNQYYAQSPVREAPLKHNYNSSLKQGFVRFFLKIFVRCAPN